MHPVWRFTLDAEVCHPGVKFGSRQAPDARQVEVVEVFRQPELSKQLRVIPYFFLTPCQRRRLLRSA